MVVVDVKDLVLSIPVVDVAEQDGKMDLFMAREISIYFVQRFGIYVPYELVLKCIGSFRRAGVRSRYIYRAVLRYIANKYGIDVWGIISYQLYKYYLDKGVFKLCEEEVEKEARS